MFKRKFKIATTQELLSKTTRISEFRRRLVLTGLVRGISPSWNFFRTPRSIYWLQKGEVDSPSERRLTNHNDILRDKGSYRKRGNKKGATHCGKSEKALSSGARKGEGVGPTRARERGGL